MAEKNPKPLHLADYNKRVPANKYYDYDPRPESLRKTTEEEIEQFAIDNQYIKKTSGWTHIIQIKYKDYELSDEQKQVLLHNIEEFKNSLKISSCGTASFVNTNLCYVPIGTMGQSANKGWQKIRCIRVTASIFQEFKTSKDPASIIQKQLWDPLKDLSHVPAIKWGNENESRAIADFEKTHGPVEKCGIFVSKLKSFLAASPDGLQKDNLIEVKCPFAIRHLHPLLDYDEVKNKKTFFCKKVGDSLELRRFHKYWWQVQCQMFVTGIHTTKFIC